jgi:UDP-GlcNAc:undecaprenyl-phosphate/decaprenyl-phosphate GlcNAc-1-phosphate transferase
MMLYILTFILAAGLSIYITPIVRKGALQYDIVDRPDGKLKQQKQPVAYLGGIAVYLSFLLTLALTFELSREILGILLSGTIVVILGIIDDFKVLPPRVKFIGQAIAAFVLIKSGIYIKLVFLPSWFCLILTFCWILTITNAFNIIDVMDGLAAGIGCVSAGILFIVAIMNQHHVIATLTIALAGALLGFLKYNFAPARIYLGDTGSLFIGLILGALSMIGSYTQKNAVACIAPVIILGIPIFDTLFVIYIRWLRGLPILYGSPDHFALRLRKWRLTTRQTVIISYSAGFLLGLLSLGLLLVPSNIVAIAVLVVVVILGGSVALFLKQIDMSL